MQGQEESKAIQNIKISIQKDSNSPQKAVRNRSWSFRSLFFCCPPQSQTLENDRKKNNINSFASNHYLNGEPNSFVNFSKEKGNNDLATIESGGDSIFLLGKGLKKIVCRTVKTNLSKKASPLKIEKGNDFGTSKTGHDSNESLNPKRSLSEMAEITVRSEETTYQFTRHEIFSLYSQGIRVEKSDWIEVTPECVAEHIARRLSGNFVIDALSGYGGNAIQFAKYCPFVIGVEIESHKIKKAEHNAGIYRVNHLIDLIQADFFSLKKLHADVVFLAPSELQLEKGEKFSIQHHFSPNLPELIKHSLTLANSLCILLPPYANPEELAVMFCDIFNEDPERYNHLNYAIEVESLYLDDILISIIVIFGEISKITNDERRDLLLQLMEANDKHQWQTVYSEKFASRVFKQVGLHRSLTILGELEAKSLRSDATFEAFLKQVKSKKLISEEMLKQLQQPDTASQLRSMSQESLQAPKLLQAWSGTEGNGQSDNHQDRDGPGTINKTPSNKRIMGEFSHQNSHKTDGMRDMPHQGESYGQGRNMNNENMENSPGKSVGIPSRQDDEGREQGARSFAASDMAVSSYSMKSDAMLDSFSDTEAQYMLAVEVDQTKNRNNSISSTENHNKNSPVKKTKKQKSTEPEEAEKEKFLNLV